jgi:hypothetical protein|tara:strand:- start:2228 stop:2938 length:711 start_codon:yes stop_codon:yes gene_type:complete
MPEENHPSNAEPPPRRFGTQFYNDPDFFLNSDVANMVENPNKVITEASMMGGVIHEVLQHAKVASEHPEIGKEVEAGEFPTAEELTTSVGAMTLSNITQMVPAIAEEYIMAPATLGSEGAERDKRMEEVTHARDLGLQGAEEWWAGNIINAGGGGHAPRPPELGPLEFSDKKVEIDPHLINTDTDFAGAVENRERFGPSADNDPNTFISHILKPISEGNIDPDFFTNPDIWGDDDD